MLEATLLALGILVASYVTASVFQVSFGLIALVLGGIVGGLGAFLAQPSRYDPESPQNRVTFSNDHLNELWEQQFEYDQEHSVPAYGFENVMTWGGFAAAAIGVLLLILRR